MDCREKPLTAFSTFDMTAFSTFDMFTPKLHIHVNLMVCSLNPFEPFKSMRASLLLHLCCYVSRFLYSAQTEREAALCCWSEED